MESKRAQRAGGLGAILLVACTALPFAGCQRGSVPNELPRSWSLAEMTEATPPYRVEGRVYALAWQVVEDERPVRVESCLVLKVLEQEDGHGRWCLAHLYRRPDEEKPEWSVSMIHVTGKEGTRYFPGLWIHHSKRFQDRPGNKELYASLAPEEVGWSFEQEKGWKFVGCGVCEKSWREALGERPTRFFGR
jgi:hypothetical protein